MEASKCPKCGAGTVSDTVTGLGGGAVTYECRTRNTLHLGGIIETSSCLRNQLAQRDEQLAGVRRLYASEGLDLLEARRELATKQAVIDGVREVMSTMERRLRDGLDYVDAVALHRDEIDALLAEDKEADDGNE